MALAGGPHKGGAPDAAAETDCPTTGHPHEGGDAAGDAALTPLPALRRLPPAMNSLTRSLLRFTSTALVALGFVLAPLAWAQQAQLETKPADAYFTKFEPRKAPAPSGLRLQAGDRLAICGDSITEQKMYSRIMETYLTVCVPDLKVTVRQYGWGGERAPGFLARMTNDCLRFKPSLATTCYGMNDHGYRPYEETIGAEYRRASTAIVRAFKAHGTRVIQGSPGCVGTKAQPGWDAAGVEAKNLNLCTLRNLGIEIAQQENVGFADVFWPMLTAGFAAQQRYDAGYAIAGKDGVHPDWAGQLVMAYAFLKAMGLEGDLGTITVDLPAGKATATQGHEVAGFADNELKLTSARYPFCAAGAPDKDNSIRSAMTLVPFNQDLNRLMLVVKGGAAANFKVTWGNASRSYPAGQLAKGVNLADDFGVNPFSEAFAKVDAAVAAKQNYETRQVKMLFHGDEGHADMDATAALTEQVRKPLADAIAAAFVPVTHTLRIEAQ